jgi:hypothetical protein
MAPNLVAHITALAAILQSDTAGARSEVFRVYRAGVGEARWEGRLLMFTVIIIASPFITKMVRLTLRTM